MTEARQQEILELAYEDYKEALEDNTFINPDQAAYNFALNCITAEVWKDYGITCPAEAAGNDEAAREIHWLAQLFRGTVS